MKYKVWAASGNAHLWQFESLKAEIKAHLIDYETTGNLINFVIYETAEPVDADLFKKRGFNYRVVNSQNKTKNGGI